MARAASTRTTRARRKTRARRWRIALITTLCTLGVTAAACVAVIVGVAITAFNDLGDSIDELGGAVAQPLQPAPPIDPVSRYSEEQLGNAATIMAAGRDLGLPLRDQAIAVMTAMGESSLRNIDYGDWETNGVTNPDGSRTTSIGLFQQQDGWGSREQRLDPYTAATLFYRAMLRKVPDAERTQLQPTIVAHRTQINRDPNHYARYWQAAVAVVERLSGEAVPDAG